MHRFAVVVAAGIAVCLAGCDGEGNNGPAAFTLQVTPTEMIDTIPLQRCVLLATVQPAPGLGNLSSPVRISAEAWGAAVTVEHQDITPGEVAEVTVIPLRNQQPPPIRTAGEGQGPTVNVTIRAEHSEQTRTVTVPIRLWSQERDLVGPTAAEVRDLFLPWLAQSRPELGITAGTQWTGTIVTPHILVVTHYLFLSPEWEMHVYWHVMIPPYDWAKLELRRRFQGTKPSLAFEIPSRSAVPLTVQEIEPSDTLWR